jgi:hypothetical protein
MTAQTEAAGASSPRQPGPRWRRWLPLYLLLAVCFAPVVASYYIYYVAPPEGRTNYGTLLDPQRPVPPLTLTHLDGAPFDAAAWRGQWTMLAVDGAACGPACEKKLWNMRQVRLTTGKDRDRVARVLLMTDTAPLETRLLREFDGTRFLRADAAQLRAWLRAAGADGPLEAHVWIVDPLGNLMLRWPEDADPQRMKRDLTRLLRASRVG